MPAFFDIEAIREALPIEQLLEARGVRLQRGRGPCLVCGTSESSTAFSTREGRWRCFACGAHGDVVDLVATLDRIPLREAITRTAGLAGLSPGRCPQHRLPRPKSPEMIAREAGERAWKPFLAAIQTREFIVAVYVTFVGRRGLDHYLSSFVGQLLADAHDHELVAEYVYTTVMEDPR